MGRPFRNGIVGFAIGSFNIPCILDERGKKLSKPLRIRKYIYNIELKLTQIGVADELAAAASLLMGQATQKKPVVVIKGCNLNLNTSSTAKDLIRSENEDLFR